MWLLAGGFLALVTVAALASGGGRMAIPEWQRHVIERVASHESNGAGGYSAVNPNLDGAGLSWGMLQWAQVPGSLGVLLRKLYDRMPGKFEALFGGPELARQLLQVTSTKGSMAPVGGVVLWAEPWLARFKAAGADPDVQAVQLEEAATGEHMLGALAVANTLGIKTDRSMSLFFDAAIQQGPAGAMSAARRALQNGVPVGDPRLLRLFATSCAAPYRSTTEPGPHKSAPRLQWRPVGSEWHVFAGKWDLYVDISRRRNAIVADPKLGDLPVG
jgi:hypothetical protein